MSDQNSNKIEDLIHSGRWVELREKIKAKGLPFPCKCDCHRDGVQLLHFMACCPLCYQKYISEDGVVDLVRFESLWKKKQYTKPTE